MNDVNALIVDDQPSTLMLMHAILDHAGYHVVECSRGQRAIEALSADEYDFVVLDLNLPDISGMDLLQSPQLMPRRLPPVLGITASVTPQLEQQAIAAGMCRLLEKPISYEKLTEAVVDAVNIAKAAERADSTTPAIDHVILTQIQDMSDESLAHRFVDQAVVDASRCLEQMRAAAARDDAGTWRQHAQALDGVALTIGARRLANDIAMVLARSTAELRPLLGKINSQFAELLDEAQLLLAEWLATVGSELPKRRHPLHRRLTDREMCVLSWTAAGKTASAIAMILGISPRTVNFHITTLLMKLDAANKTQAVAKAVMLGLLKVGDMPLTSDEHPKQ